jgi:RecJ-like exonuclease
VPIVITVAEPGPGERLCIWCKGKGVYSKYDKGWSSVVYSPELDAKIPCFVCNGTGLVREIS